MTKQEYMKPVMKVIKLQHKRQILAGSVTSVKTTGLDEDLTLPNNEEPKSGQVWGEAW